MRKSWRKGSRKSSINTVAAVLIIVLAYVILLPVSEEQTAGQNAQITTQQTENNGKVDEPTDSGASTDVQEDTGLSIQTVESPIKVTQLEGMVPGGHIKAVVKRVVDGDTIRAEYRGEEYRVRLLCIDTPESVKNGMKEQPFGKQAAEKLEEMIQGKEVRLLFEKGLWDNYDRLLAYVILEDGTCVNEIMVSEGFARVNSVKPNIVHRDYFNSLQAKAIEEGKGLWSLPEEERPFVKKDGNYYIPRYYEDEAA